MYRLVFASRLETAEAFQDWVCEEVCLILEFKNIKITPMRRVKQAYKTSLHAIYETHGALDPNNEGGAVYISE